MQVRLFTGKGGVGKTTIAAATALKASKNGLKTLVMSTDPAHSLSDAFNIKLEPEPLQIGENLYAQELNVYYSMKKYWESLRKMILEMLKWQGMDRIQAEELSALPGMEEVSAFLWLEKYHSEKEFDFIVIDSAPTGETLSMLSIPQMAKWWTSKLFMMPKFAAKTMGTAINATLGIPFTQSMDELETMLEKLEIINSILTDPEKTAARIVLNPEKMVIEEGRRAYTYLQLYGFNVDSIYVNRIIPDKKGGEFFKEYISSQKGYLETIKKDFSPLKIFEIPHAGKEVFGFKVLDKFGDLIYKDLDPSEIFFTGKPFDIEEIKGGYLMKLSLPFSKKENCSVMKNGHYLIVNLEDKRRHIYLPRFLLYYEISRTYFESGFFFIEFKESQS